MMHLEKSREKKNSKAFIFTTDAFFALPLVILAISTFVAFSVTLRDNITMQEYAYMLAKDALSTLIEASPGQVSEISSDSSFVYLLIDYTSRGTSTYDERANETASVLDAMFPINAGYILEYKNATDTQWKVIRAYANNPDKFSRYTIQVSSTRVVSAISDWDIDYRNASECRAQVVCGTASTIYEEGQVMGPILLRIRVFL